MLPESPSVAPGWLLPLNEISRLPMLCGSRPPPSWSLRPSVFFWSIFFSKFSRLTSFADQRQPSLPLFFLPIIWPWLIDLLFFLQAVFKCLVLALCFLNFLFHPLLPILLVDHLLSRRLRSRCCDCCWPASGRYGFNRRWPRSPAHARSSIVLSVSALTSSYSSSFRLSSQQVEEGSTASVCLCESLLQLLEDAPAGLGILHLQDLGEPLDELQNWLELSRQLVRDAAPEQTLVAG